MGTNDSAALLPYMAVFVRVVEAGSFSGAARLLGSTPSAVSRQVARLEQALALLPNQALELSEEAFDLDDEAYAEVVGRVIADEIGRGEGANFVIKRRV
ncbi:LysR family transcriptional regulator, partial [Acinetobacter baumannii]